MSADLEERLSLPNFRVNKRIVSATSWILLSGVVIYLFPLWLFSVVVTGMAGIALSELFSLARDRNIPIHSLTGFSAGLFIPILTYLVAVRLTPIQNLEQLDGLLVAGLLLALFLAQTTRRENTLALAIVGVTFLSVFYISWLFSFLIKLQVHPQGPHLVAYLLLVTKGSDIGGYLVGSSFGRHRLIPRISPNKSVEGFLGGLAVSLSAAFFCRFLLPEVPLWQLLGLGLVLGGVSQFGDLAESIIKRDCQVKDSGTIVPGMGGMLDLIDSILMTAPLFYYWVVMVWDRRLLLE